MSGDLVIDIQSISKAYPLYAKPLDMLKELVFGKVRHDLFWALRDISFRVHAGQRIGIIGPNGAGKSTLLQIIAGNLQPTKGSLSVNGSISALLSLVPAWNPEQTGIENIRFNLLLRGCNPSKIAILIEDIISFAELGPFIFQPVKTYSSGMSARLSFAIATAISPEILIIDEVLGAGDGYFAGKATKRMKEFCDRGKALLFVSHNTAAVQQMCDTVIWLQNGSIRLLGNAEYVLRQYELDYRQAEDELTRSQNARAASFRNSIASPDELTNHSRLRFRIVPEQTGRFVSTHFVRSIQIDGISGSKTINIPLDAVNIDQPDIMAAIDTMNSEWGRLHERATHLSRILSRLNGKRPGGHFLVNLPSVTGIVRFQVRIVDECKGAKEKIALEVLDLTIGHWKPIKLTNLAEADTISTYTFIGEASIPEESVMTEIKDKLISENMPDVEILGVSLLVNNEPKALVRERSSFEIVVNVKFNRVLDVADVGIKISRSDGVYVFWQSSGLEGANLIRPIGIKTLRFEFRNCPMGAGDYSINVHVSNGWNYPQNYPYSHLLARSVGALSFRIFPEMEGLDFGVLNMRVPVSVD